MKIAIKIENLHQNVALLTNYEPMNLTQKPRLTTFYHYMNDMKNSMQNICTYTQMWTILSVLTKTKPDPITFSKFLELIGKVYKTKEIQSRNCDWAFCPS